MATKTTTIRAALKLLEKEGYTVTKKRQDPRIGDVVRFKCDEGEPYDVLITFHQTDNSYDGDQYDFGGVIVSEMKYADQSTDAIWIDRNEWAKDDGQYEVIGHVNLDKWIKR